MFVRELVALDGTDMSEFMLIDVDGCPTDLAIMKPIEKTSNSGQVLETRFEAFKFPTSDIVQFKALVTPCVANCEPSKCNLNLPSGRTSQTLSYGKRRRRRSSEDQPQDSASPVLSDTDNVVVVESLSVTDKFTASKKDRKKIEQDDHSEVYSSVEGNAVLLAAFTNVSLAPLAEDPDIDAYSGSKVARMALNSTCLNVVSLVVFGVAFLVGQTVLLVSWSFACNRKRNNALVDNELIYGSSNWSVRSSVPSVTGTSKNYMPYSEGNMLYAVPSRQSAPYLYS